MPRMDSHPIAFAAGEAIADQPSALLLVWETAGAIKYRTYPADSLAVLIGVHDLLGRAIDAATEAVKYDDEDGDDE